MVKEVQCKGRGKVIFPFHSCIHGVMETGMRAYVFVQTRFRRLRDARHVLFDKTAVTH